MSGPSKSALALEPVALAAAQSVLAGGGLLPGGTQWHPEYPLLETMTGLCLLMEAHRMSGWGADCVPTWWMYQIVVATTTGPMVVGDVGFHSPPQPQPVSAAPSQSATEVEIGYDVVPSMRGRGIATAACLALLDRAWRDGAGAVRADTEPDNHPSRRVLAKAGFLAQADGSYLVRRPDPQSRRRP